jgi:hypothetical protein
MKDLVLSQRMMLVKSSQVFHRVRLRKAEISMAASALMTMAEVAIETSAFLNLIWWKTREDFTTTTTGV